MAGVHRRGRVIALVLILILVVASGGFLLWDDNRSTCEPLEMDAAVLQTVSDRLPVPQETVEGETVLQEKAFRGIVVYYAEPVTEQRAQALAAYFQEQAQQYQGTYVPLHGGLAAALVGNHVYSSVIDKVGYGWLSYKGNLYAADTSREQAQGKPNYRNRYEFFFVKDRASYHFVLFSSRQNPEKALSAAAEYLSARVQPNAP